MKTIVLSTIAVLLINVTGLMPQQFGSVAGTFSNENLTIYLNGENGNYTGKIIMNEMTFPVAIQCPDGKSIQGSYSYQGANFPIYGTLAGNTMNLINDGFRFALQRQTSLPAATQPVAQTSSVSSAPNQKLTSEEVGDPYFGFKFVPPSGWIAQKTDAGYVLGSNSEQGIILIIPHHYQNLDAMKSAAEEGLADENGTQLQMKGSAQQFGDSGIEVNFEGLVQWQQAKAHAIGMLSPSGGGVTIIVATESARFGQIYENYARSIAKSVKFFKPETPSAVNEWRQKLNNSRLTYLWSYYSGGGTDGSYVGGSQKTVIDLCAKGNFRFFDDSQVAADGGGASGYSGGSSNGDGTWEISSQGQSPLLRLKFHNGKVFEYVLTIQDGKTYLNDKRFFRTYSDDDNAEYRPQCW
ncbi:hypothetical protein JXJ21_12505 [candidate division KSB1 bacterium]|nr:hypothetical protein [candidate division KSB1 bacterium]